MATYHTADMMFYEAFLIGACRSVFAQQLTGKIIYMIIYNQQDLFEEFIIMPSVLIKNHDRRPLKKSETDRPEPAPYQTDVSYRLQLSFF